MYGKSSPKREFMKEFAEAFQLTLQERGELALVYAYDFRPEYKRLTIVERKGSADMLLERLREQHIHVP